MFKSTVFTISCLFAGHAFAGGGFYYGVDYLAQALNNRVQITQQTSSPPSSSLTTNSSRSDNASWGVHLGYHARRRLTDRFFLAPELRLQQLDDELLYATTLKAGSRFGTVNWHLAAGIARVDRFGTNALLFSAGAQWLVNPQTGIHLTWQQFETMRELSQSTASFGSQTITTRTDTGRELSQWLLGIRFYFHE